ncbi:MAG: Fic family protein [Syntrophomonas sp.]
MRKGSGFSKYDIKEQTRSIYFYPDCDVLVNKANIKDINELAEYEKELTGYRLIEIGGNEATRGNLGATHLKKIHKYIFQDVYKFAGKYRTEDISKGNTRFFPIQHIEENIIGLLGNLRNENYLKGLDKEQFALRAAFYMAELNVIHPFREGNGRTIREFIRQLALKCGYNIDWSLIDKDELLAATIISVNTEYSQLANQILKAIQ